MNLAWKSEYHGSKNVLNFGEIFSFYLKDETVTQEPPTTTRISLFNIRTLAPIPTRTTTTFKPKSLADLFKHREGIKIGTTTTENGNEEATESPSRYGFKEDSIVVITIFDDKHFCSSFFPKNTL